VRAGFAGPHPPWCWDASQTGISGNTGRNLLSMENNHDAGPTGMSLAIGVIMLSYLAWDTSRFVA